MHNLTGGGCIVVAVALIAVAPIAVALIAVALIAVAPTGCASKRGKVM